MNHPHENGSSYGVAHTPEASRRPPADAWAKCWANAALRTIETKIELPQALAGDFVLEDPPHTRKEPPVLDHPNETGGATVAPRPVAPQASRLLLLNPRGSVFAPPYRGILPTLDAAAIWTTYRETPGELSGLMGSGSLVGASMSLGFVACVTEGPSAENQRFVRFYGDFDGRADDHPHPDVCVAAAVARHLEEHPEDWTKVLVCREGTREPIVAQPGYVLAHVDGHEIGPNRRTVLELAADAIERDTLYDWFHVDMTPWHLAGIRFAAYVPPNTRWRPLWEAWVRRVVLDNRRVLVSNSVGSGPDEPTGLVSGYSVERVWNQSGPTWEELGPWGFVGPTVREGCTGGWFGMRRWGWSTVSYSPPKVPTMPAEIERTGRELAMAAALVLLTADGPPTGFGPWLAPFCTVRGAWWNGPAQYPWLARWLALTPIGPPQWLENGLEPLASPPDARESKERNSILIVRELADPVRRARYVLALNPNTVPIQGVAPLSASCVRTANY